MYSQALLVTAISYKAAKRDTITCLKTSVDTVSGRIIGLAEWYDRKFPETDYCTGDLLCSREGKRHKANCLGRVEPMNRYAKGLKNA